MIALAEKTVQVQAVQHVRACRLRLEFNDGKVTEVDFEPFLRAAAHPAIRRYIQPRRFQQFAITATLCHWNDFGLLFPMADRYDGVIR